MFLSTHKLDIFCFGVTSHHSKQPPDTVYNIHHSLSYSFNANNGIKERNDQQRSKAKQDVEELLGKGEKKKKKGTSSLCDLSSSSMKLSSGPLGLASLERKPLPGIMLQGVLGSLQGLSKSWTGANAKDGEKEKVRRKNEKDREIQNSSSEKDRNIGSYRSDSIPSTSSGATDVSYVKDKRQQ
jgi:hypothetical protein